MDGLLLREICMYAGVTRRAVQGYEKMGLVSPTGKNKMGHLLYDRGSLEKIKKIRQLQERGFSLKEIKWLETDSREEVKSALEKKIVILRQNYNYLQETIHIVENMINNL